VKILLNLILFLVMTCPFVFYQGVTNTFDKIISFPLRFFQHLSTSIYKKRLIIPCLCIAFFFQNCKKEHEPSGAVFRGRTVLIYMAANNDLAADAVRSFDAMRAGAINFQGNLLVLLKTKPSVSYLIRINSSSKSIDTLKVYYGYNTSDPKFLSKVIDDSKTVAPSNSYGLVLWSHGTSWAPARNPIPNAIGYDEGSEMDIKAFKNALHGNLDFILFDACSMASIEVIYELRNKANYILASPSEILSSSYPYQSIVPLLFGGPDDLRRAGEKFIQCYDTLSGQYASATVSLIDTKELNNLAVFIKELLSKKLPARDFHRKDLQKLNFDIGSAVDAFDFLDFFDKNYSKEDFHQIKNQLEKTIIYKDHTSAFLGNPIKTFSGLSIYLPVSQDTLIEYYSTLSWLTESGWGQLFGR
jgi:hypothetical protein